MTMAALPTHRGGMDAPPSTHSQAPVSHHGTQQSSPCSYHGGPGSKLADLAVGPEEHPAEHGHKQGLQVPAEPACPSPRIQNSPEHFPSITVTQV